MMKNRIMLMMLFAALVFTLTACQKNPSAAPAETETTLAQEEETTGAPEDQEEAESTITGTLIDAAMSTLILETDSGEDYIFAKENPDISGLSDGLTLGNRITLTYTGTLNGTDTSDVNVIAISDAED